MRSSAELREGFLSYFESKGHVRLPSGSLVPAMFDPSVLLTTAGMQPLPYESVYGATKAFALNFSDALHAELKRTGVKVLAVNPGPVQTEWQQVAGYDETGAEVMPGMIDADQCVAEALRAYDRGKRSMIPGRFFRNFMRLNSPAPRAVALRVAERMYRPKTPPPGGGSNGS